MINEVYIHQPISWLCQGLTDAASQFYSAVKTDIKKVYARRSIELTEIALLLLQVSDKIEEMKVKLNAKDCRECCEQIVWYLRIKLLHADGLKVRTTFIVLDFLVKNNQNQIHYQLNRRRVMKTIGIVVRTNYFQGDSRISSLGLDIIQSWYIAFLPRAQMFQNIIDTYLKLKYKYCCRFPRAETEERVKIFLGPNCFYETSYSSIPVDQFMMNPITSSICNDKVAARHETTDSIREEAKEISEQDLLQFDDIISIENIDSAAHSIGTGEESWGTYHANSISNNPFTSTNVVEPPQYLFPPTSNRNPFVVQRIERSNSSAPSHYVTTSGNPFVTLASEQNTLSSSNYEGLVDLNLVQNKVESDPISARNCNKLIDSSLESSVMDLFNDLKTTAPIKPPKHQAILQMNAASEIVDQSKFDQIKNTEPLQQECSVDHSISNQTVIDDESGKIRESDILSPSPAVAAKSVKATAYVTPGVDHNNIIKFYGNNRVVIKKT